MGRIAFLLLALFAEMERTFTAERAAHARSVAEANGPPRPFRPGDAPGMQKASFPVAGVRRCLLGSGRPVASGSGSGAR